MEISYLDCCKFNSLYELASYFTSNTRCIQFLEDVRWGDSIVCPYCGSVHTYTRHDGRHICKNCHKSFSVLQGTIFENTKVSLVKWFMAMYLISSHKKGISSCQLAKDIKVTQKTAWYMLQKVRTLFALEYTEQLSGDIELDEVYIGGKEKWKHLSRHTSGTQGRSTKTKTPVFGMLENGTYIDKHGVECKTTYVRAFVVPATDGKTLLPIVSKHIARGSHITTDELNSYGKLFDMGYSHSVVHHGEKEFIREGVNTNAMEGFWSHFRRMITGCYHDISDKYLQRYVDESVYRWNTRKMDESHRFVHMFNKCIGSVKPYAVLKLCRYV